MNALGDMQPFNEMIQDIRRKYPGNGGASTPPPPEPEADRNEANRKRMDEFFDEYIEMERKKGTLTDERYNSLCDQLSARLDFDFSDRKITDDTKLYRDARMRADFEKEVVATEKPKPHRLQRLYFAPFSPEALQVMIDSKLRPKSCAIYSFLCLNCYIVSGVAHVSKYDVIETLNLSHKNAPSYFKELLRTGLIVDKDNHRSRKKKTRFYLPHTHQHAKDIAKEEVGDMFDGGDWVLMTPEAVEILTNEKKIHGTHWYVYAYLCLNAYRETGVTMKALPKASILRDLNPYVSRRTIFRVFKTLEKLGLIIREKHKKDVFFLPHILRKFAELSVKNGA